MYFLPLNQISVHGALLFFGNGAGSLERYRGIVADGPCSGGIVLNLTFPDGPGGHNGMPASEMNTVGIGGRQHLVIGREHPSDHV